MMRLISCHSNICRFVLAIAILGSAASIGARSVHAQNTSRGAVLGGLGGAVAGALIGDHNGKAGAGAAIGGAIGAVGGAVLGNARDQELSQQRQRQYYAQQERVYVQQQQQQAFIQAAVSTADIVSMSRSGLSDSVIINQIHSRGVQRQLQVSDIISLHQQGVSENVITALQNAQIGSAPQNPVVIQQQPVVVHQQPVVVHEQYVVPRYSPPPTYYYHRGYRRGF